jgi:hypothetical protein
MKKPAASKKAAISKLDHKRQLARERQRRHRQNEAKGIVVRVPSSVVSSLRPSSIKLPLSTSSQLVSTAGQSSIVSAMSDYVFRKVDGAFYEMLREAIPIFDSAIRQSITLEGFLRPIGDDMELVRDLEDFFLNVPVNDMQKGIQAFQENTSNEKFEQGFAVTEFIANKKRDDIDRLVVADSKSIIFRRNASGRVEPWFRSGTPKQSGYTMPASVIDAILNVRYGRSVSYNGVTEVRLVPDNKNYFSIGNENQDPHGVSIMRSTEFVSQIIVTIQNGFKHIGERYGDPMHHVHYKAGKGGGDLETRRKLIETDFNNIVTAKRKGKSGDLVTAGGPDSDVKVEVIGGQNQIYSFEVPLRHLLEQIVAKTNLPAWLLGIYWSTTERMATLEIEAALSSAKIRQLAMLPEYIKLCANFLRLRGRTWNRITTSTDSPGDWGLIFESPSYRDVMTMANARFLNAQASLMERGQAGPTTATSVTVGGATFELGRVKESGVRSQEPGGECSCGHHKSTINNRQSTIEATKELQRPFPWPALDKIEAEYEAELKSTWQLLKKKVFNIAKLPLASAEEGQASASSSPLPSVGEGRVRGGSLSGITKAPFAFDDAQRRLVMNALKEFLGWYEPNLSDPANDDSNVRWYYGQSYSAGLIQAAEMVGKERPILDILRNNEIFTEVITDGFSLVKDNATRAIRNDIIMAMEQGVVDGVNPRDVARTLNELFHDKNSDWERLARTEMSGAAERAKLDEWEERGIDTSRAVSVPVHPRCRCSTTVEEVKGKWRAKFAPAPDACPLCLSMQEGDKGLSPLESATLVNLWKGMERSAFYFKYW